MIYSIMKCYWLKCEFKQNWFRLCSKLILSFQKSTCRSAGILLYMDLLLYSKYTTKYTINKINNMYIHVIQHTPTRPEHEHQEKTHTSIRKDVRMTLKKHILNTKRTMLKQAVLKDESFGLFKYGFSILKYVFLFGDFCSTLRITCIMTNSEILYQ